MLVLLGLVLVLVALLAYRFVFSQAAGGLSGTLSAARARPVGLLDANPSHLSRVAEIAGMRLGAVYAGHDARDPMEPLVRQRETQELPANEGRSDEEAAVSLPPMSLYGIIWDPETPIALIDGMDLRVGDRIKGARVVEIGFDRVVLSYRSKQFVLTVD